MIRPLGSFVDFFFAKLLAPFLTKVLNEGRKGGRLPATMLQGITSVLYKKKDPTDPRNYRPITLLNNDSPPVDAYSVVP